ncbi:mechanosensitive ion channel family protein [Methylopila turkensis]|uniref:Small-conductance mechanosensitive channel n=1 Tax=Methylopila turkensis TaxID=1437816 RepID=A0A9W6JR49_9HYPH|nr:mechanosensitive ion channel domain-containing protein [Methylopila turkensis]GLK81737.1 mechanosensitive ion channel protein MscS [Methylopila turkensis]
MPDVPIDFTFLSNLVVVYGFNVVGAIVLAVVGFWVAGAIHNGVHRGLLASKRMDVTVASFLASLAQYATLAVVLVAILQLVGIQATSLIAVLGAASLAVGLALQGTLSNMAAGVMLLLFRPFKVGDAIEVAGKAGTVRDLNLFFTELASGDNVQVLIPNAQVWGTALTNKSKYPTRRVETTLTAPASQDFEAARAEIAAFLSANPHALASPAPVVTPTAYSDGAVEYAVKVWTPADQLQALQADLVRYRRDRAHAQAEPQAAE